MTVIWRCKGCGTEHANAGEPWHCGCGSKLYEIVKYWGQA